jgi:hypothetical protein
VGTNYQVLIVNFWGGVLQIDKNFLISYFGNKIVRGFILYIMLNVWLNDTEPDIARIAERVDALHLSHSPPSPSSPPSPHHAIPRAHPSSLT